MEATGRTLHLEHDALDPSCELSPYRSDFGVIHGSDREYFSGSLQREANPHSQLQIFKPGNSAVDRYFRIVVNLVGLLLAGHVANDNLIEARGNHHPFPRLRISRLGGR